MASIPENHDPRFGEAEANVDRGEAWRFRDLDAPNPLTIEVTGWSTGVTKLGEAEFLAGVDRDGKKWSVLVGSVVLVKKLIEGLVEEWSDEKGFVVVETLGRVQPGEIISIKYTGDKQGQTFAYPNFRVSRRPASTEPAEGGVDDDSIPF